MRQSNDKKLDAAVLVGVLLSVGCRAAEPRGGEPVGATTSAAVSAMPPPQRAAGPPAPSAAPAKAGTEDNWTRCYSGFSAVGHPEVELHRLGLLCGPSNGMYLLPDRLEGTVDENGKEGRHTVRTARGVCYRFFSVGDSSIEDLEVEVAAAFERGTTVDTRGERWAVVPPASPLCPRSEEQIVTVRTHGGSGRYVIGIWYLP